MSISIMHFERKVMKMARKYPQKITIYATHEWEWK